MKKFGTPIGAGPGSANEKVGFAAVGTPGPVGPVGGLGECEVVVEVLVPVGPLEPLLPLGPLGPLEPCFEAEPRFLPVPLFGGGFVVVLVVEDGAVGPLEPLGTVTEGVVLEVGAHEAVAFCTGPTPAGIICEAGVPGGTLTLKDSVWPVTSVTVTVH